MIQWWRRRTYVLARLNLKNNWDEEIDADEEGWLLEVLKKYPELNFPQEILDNFSKMRDESHSEVDLAHHTFPDGEPFEIESVTHLREKCTLTSKAIVIYDK